MTITTTDPRVNFTPTTGRVRDRFIDHSIMMGSAIGGPPEYAAAFDRWLASVTNAVRTVTTEAEYAALPVGSVIRGNRHSQVAERVDETEDEGFRWIYTGSNDVSFQHETIARDLGEATVLFTP